jgi:hypothetical protein
MENTHKLSSFYPELPEVFLVVRKERRKRYKNGYSNWDGKVGYDVWVVEDSENEVFCSGNTRKEAVLEYLFRRAKAFKVDKADYKLKKLK